MDEAKRIDFDEPEDDQVNEEAETAAQSTSETDETVEDGQEADETATEGDEPAESDEQDDAANEAKDTIVTLKGGDQVPLEELKLGYMRDRDYRHKTQENANKGRALEEMTTRVTRTVDAVANYLAGMLPDEPQPALAIQRPDEYVRQKAIYDSALAQVNEIIRLANEPKEVGNKLSKDQEDEQIAFQDAKLAEAFPQTRKSPEERKKFFEQAFQTAREIGFSDEELKGQIDHRMFKLAHYARLGLEAEQAKSKAMAKVQSAPLAQVKAKQRASVNADVQKNRDAMKRLSKSGSLKDALLIDFD
jgi:hypothetical protein